MCELKLGISNGNVSVRKDGLDIRVLMCVVSSVLRYGKVRYKYIFLTRVSNITMSLMTVIIKAAKRHWFLPLLHYEIKYQCFDYGYYCLSNLFRSYSVNWSHKLYLSVVTFS